MMSILYKAAAIFTAFIALECSTAHADSGNGATVIKEFGCFISTNASGLPVDLFTSEKTHSVATPSGNSILKCDFVIPEGFEPNRAIINEGFLCNTFLG